MMVEVPLIVDVESGVNDMLDRDGSRTPIQFHISNDRDLHPLDAQVVQAATKWKRVALRQFDCGVGEGICTDMRAVRKDYFLDHDHSAYVDQWDWERVITSEAAQSEFPEIDRQQHLEGDRRRRKICPVSFPAVARLPLSRPAREHLTFIHAEDILSMYPTLPRKQRETAILQELPRGFHHRDRLAVARRLSARNASRRLRRLDHRYPRWRLAEHTHGLNGDILVWNPVTKRRHELTSMGIRVTAETLKQQLTMSKQLDFLQLPYHKAILNNQIPLSVGGGIGQSRTLMLLLRKAHLGEVSVTVWPKILKEMCAQKEIFVLE